MHKSGVQVISSLMGAIMKVPFPPTITAIRLETGAEGSSESDRGSAACCKGSIYGGRETLGISFLGFE